MLSIDEAIARKRQQAEEQRSNIGTFDDEYSKKCEVWAEEHEQIAKWLEELVDTIKDKIEELSKYAESQYNKAIDDVLRLQKYTFYDTSNEFMNIRIDAISIEDILKLKESE